MLLERTKPRAFQECAYAARILLWNEYRNSIVLFGRLFKQIENHLRFVVHFHLELIVAILNGEIFVGDIQRGQHERLEFRRGRRFAHDLFDIVVQELRHFHRTRRIGIGSDLIFLIQDLDGNSVLFLSRCFLCHRG